MPNRIKKVCVTGRIPTRVPRGIQVLLHTRHCWDVVETCGCERGDMSRVSGSRCTCVRV